MLLHCLLVCTVSGKHSLITLIFVSLNKCDFFPLATFKICSAFLVFSNLIMRRFGVVFTVFILPVVHRTSWICGFTVSTISGVFSVIISSDIFVSPPPTFFLELQLYICIDHLILFYRLLRLCSFLFQSFFFFFWSMCFSFYCCL